MTLKRLIRHELGFYYVEGETPVTDNKDLLDAKILADGCDPKPVSGQAKPVAEGETAIELYRNS